MANENEPREKPSIIIDDDWKSQVEREREELRKREGDDSTEDITSSQQGSSPAAGNPTDQKVEVPPASFPVLVMTLATQALTSLGIVPGPDGKTIDPPQLPIAKHLIDTVSMLEEKTRGNLDEQERALMTESLNELRLAYVSVAKKQQS